eukprot:scaffold5157_cov100-Cylindrotheca_fusiformis.AAC.7
MLLCSSSCWKLSCFLAFGILVSDSFTLSCTRHRNFASVSPDLGFGIKVSAGEESEPDLFDYFDPLLSPHAYPDGIAPGKTPVDKVEWNEGTLETGAPSSGKTLQGVEGGYATDESGKRGKIGVLLIDHGSRNEASNDRLENLAKLYQLTLVEDNIFVEHSHMEIASPSIDEGLKKLMARDVGTHVAMLLKISHCWSMQPSIPLVLRFQSSPQIQLDPTRN